MDSSNNKKRSGVITSIQFDIKRNLDDPKALEKLFRKNELAFTKEFNLIYHEIKESPTAQIWNERLNYENAGISIGPKKDLIFVFIGALIAGIIAKIPEFFEIDEEFYYSRNIGFIVFPLLSAYFIWKNKMNGKRVLFILACLLLSLIYINFLPKITNSDSVTLACIHLPLLLWTILGLSYLGDKTNHYSKRIDYLRYNGDLAVMMAIILIAGGLLTGLTLGLFSLIDLRIEEFYMKYVVVWGLASTPIVATYLVQTNSQIVSKVSPVIAKLFSPLVLITLSIYLVAIFYSGKDPYNDREFLLIFNLLLIGVMALIVFSISETAKNSSGKFGILVLFGLSAITIIVNVIALSAILFRISEWGFTPNRIAVLGSNFLILVNLTLVTYNLFKSINNKLELVKVENSIAKYLPFYSAWAILVIFLFPILFGFK